VGLDFITQKTKAFKKLWNGGRQALAEPDLMPVEEEWEEQHVLFDVREGCILSEGEELLVQTSGRLLVALRGYETVATASNPPRALMTALAKASGYTLARVARYSDLSRTADLAFRLQ
jgi:hypothetical protein